MTMRDCFGLEVALDDPVAVDRWNKTMLGFLAHAEATPKALGELIDRAPDFALGRALRGLFCLILARRELVDHARTEHTAATEAAAAGKADIRTAVYISALSDWLAGRPSRAVDRLAAFVAQHPADALAIKLDQAIRFMLGDAIGMRRSIEGVIDHYTPAHPAAGYMHGCHAFALEEAGFYDLAEAAGRHGLELAGDDAWGLHAVDHVYDMTSRPREGVNWLAERASAWSHCNNFRYHVWWHLALHHLDLGATDRALDLYDAQVRCAHTDDFRDVANAASILARLVIEGVDVGARWEELADIAERRIGDDCLVFADLHYLMSLLGAGRYAAAHRLVERIECTGNRGACDMDIVASDPGVAAARGLEALWKGRPRAALDKLLSARTKLQTIGGSHAQRDVFERLTIEAALRASEPVIARTLIDERVAWRGRGDWFARRSLSAIAAPSPPRGMELVRSEPEPAA